MHSWNIFGAWMNHEQTRTHKTHHSPNLREATTFPLIVFYVLGHGACTQMSFFLGTPNLGVPKFLKLELLQLWKPIMLFINLQLKWGLKKSFSLCLKLSNDMWHATCTKVNWGNSLLLMVRSQIGNLTHGRSFGHNLCFEYPKWVMWAHLRHLRLRAFQWYKEISIQWILTLQSVL